MPCIDFGDWYAHSVTVVDSSFLALDVAFEVAGDPKRVTRPRGCNCENLAGIFGRSAVLQIGQGTPGGTRHADRTGLA
jgi:hypothetical protein